MCGICGGFGARGARIREDVEGMVGRMGHRGPDASGIMEQGRVCLGHARLSIIDLAGGDQPIYNEDRTVCVICNGEIYNFGELTERLKDRHRFATRSDSEVIVHLWEEYNERCVDHLRGMFAFVVFDSVRGCLFAARDRFGQKPFVYADTERGLFFCSEIHPLRRVAGVRTGLNHLALDRYLSLQYIPAPDTIYEGIHKLPPAHTLLVDDGGTRISRYWRPDAEAVSTESFDTARERTRDLVREAVRLRMVADVPVGAFLSGGVDSSIVVAMMRELEPDADISTSCIGFDEARFDERPYAREMAGLFRTRHHEYVVRPAVLEIMPALVRHYGEPFGDASSVPTWYVCRETRRDVTVALSGDGGDEIFAGYNRLDSTRIVQAYRRFPALLRRGAVEPLVRLLPDSGWNEGLAGTVKNFMRGVGVPFEERFLHKATLFIPTIKRDLYTGEFQQGLCGTDTAALFRAIYRRLPARSEAERLQLADLEAWLPDDILVKVDIASMAHSLEVRSPFLDHVLAEYVLRLPFSYKYRLFNRKFILKSVGKKYIDGAFFKRRKRGFRMPVGEWFRGALREPLRRTLLEAPVFADAGLFEKAALMRLYDEHMSGRFEHTDRLWCLWFLGEWSKLEDGC